MKKKINRLGMIFLSFISVVLVTWGGISPVLADSTPSAVYHKTIEPLTDINGIQLADQYELTLDITSTTGSETQTQPLDIVFIADTSGSMTGTMGQKNSNGRYDTRIDGLKAAMKGPNGLIQNVLSNPNNRLALVSFAGDTANAVAYDDAKIILPWTTSASTAEVAVSNFTPVGFTNVEGGLHEANTLLQTARPEAKKVVILLSDGDATLYYDKNGRSARPRANDPVPTSEYDEELAELSNNGISGFYTVLLSYADKTTVAIDYISRTIANNGILNATLAANSTEELFQTFKSITDKLVPLPIRQVKITDTLSEYVELLPNDASNIRVVKMNPDGSEGEVLGTDKISIQKEVDSSSGLVSVVAKFADDYELEGGVRYALKFAVKPTQKAFDELANTTASQFYSNKEATIEYSYGDGTSTTVKETYNEQPVFTPSKIDSIPISVEWRGVPAGYSYPSEIKAQLIQDNQSAAYREVALNATGAWQGAFTSIAKGTRTYHVEAPDLVGFTKEIVTEGTSESPSYKVIYTYLPSLTIKKILLGEVNPDKEYEVQLEVYKELPQYQGLSGTYTAEVDGKTRAIVFTGGQAQITVKPNQALKILHLPTGYKYRLEEVASSTQGYQVSYQNQSGDLNTDTEILVTNHKLPSLTVKKEVTGVFANYLQTFRINLNVTNQNGSPLTGTYKAMLDAEEREITFDNGRAVLELGRNQSLKIIDLPLNATYRVEEDAESARGYVVTYEAADGTLTQDTLVKVKNDKNSVPETASDLVTSPPTILLLLALGISMFVAITLITIKHRRS